MKILHIVPGLDDPMNGIAVAAKMIAEAQRKSGAEVGVMETRDFVSSEANLRHLPPLVSQGEIWVHSMWLPETLKACWKVLQAQKANRRSSSSPSPSGLGAPRLVRMPHGCMDPIRVRYHLCRKLPLLPLEWWLFRKADRIVSTGEGEDRWIAGWHTGTEIARADLFGGVEYNPRPGLGRRKFLFVGRLHPLKGVDVLIMAIRSLKDANRLPADFRLTIIGGDEKDMRSGLEDEVERHDLPVTFLGEIKENVRCWEMQADCLVLPTLSENFGLVVKESLECGVPVITTDGARHWEGKPGVTCISGFLSATPTERVHMMAEALANFAGLPQKM